MAKKEAKSNKEKKHFFKDFKAELKKVIWPTPKQLVNSTIAVLTIVLITAVIVFVLDLVFTAMDEQGIEKLKNSIQATNTLQENVVDKNQVQNTENEQQETNVVQANSVEQNEAQEQTQKVEANPQ